MDQPAVGIKNRITDKIRQVDLNLPSGSQQLSNIRSIQQDTEIDDAYTDTVNQVEVVLSPTNQINDDIINSIGYLNIGEYIGDPRQISSSSTSYPDLNALRDDYFLKYTSNYDWNDFIRLIKFFDNSLWKTIKDFIPAKVSAATGISIKQHLLERQKYPEPQPSYSEPYYTGSIGQTAGLLSGSRIYSASDSYGSNPIVTIEGGAGGSINNLNIPVGFFRVVDTLVPITNITTSPTTLFTQGTIINAIPSKDGVSISPTGINGDNGEFKIDSNYTFKGDVEVEIRNTLSNENFTLDLVEKNGGIISTITKTVPQVTAPATNTLTLKNCTFEADQTYYFQLSTNTGTAVIVGVVRVNFIQLDASSLTPYRSGQFYDTVYNTPVGPQTKVTSDSHEFYDGEFDGSTLITSTQSLNPNNPILKPNTLTINYKTSGSLHKTLLMVN